jgi:two-component system alkaline phosphatase synthesis response regulator PhoP
MSGSAILIIDDTPLNCVLLKTFLESQGYLVATVNDGETGLALLGERPFDLILLDWVMPPPDGAAVLHTLKTSAALKHIPVLLISSSEVLPDIPAEQWQHFAGYIAKPFDHEQVATKVQLALRSHQV